MPINNTLRSEPRLQLSLGRHHRADVLRVETYICGAGHQRIAGAPGGEHETGATSGRSVAQSRYAAGDRSKTSLTPRDRLTLARWAQAPYQVSERRGSRLLPMARASLQYQSRRDSQEAPRMRRRELAEARVRFGYRRLTVLLRRDG